MKRNPNFHAKVWIFFVKKDILQIKGQVVTSHRPLSKRSMIFYVWKKQITEMGRAQS